eukprot:8450895-Lingulodinium_polyedra.AAC.1
MTRGLGGEWGIAAAKEYPAGLCQLLAMFLHEACAARLEGARRLSFTQLREGLQARGLDHLCVPLD